MKKIALVLTTIFALSAVTAFADDALVLPTGVFRITTALSYASATEQYDEDGEAQDLDMGLDSIKVINLGLALEYGINDWISAAVQWAPGYNVWSEMDDSDAKLNGAFDIFAGAKLQIVGPKAPVVNESIRFAVAPGIKIPLPGADFEEEYKNLIAQDEFIIKDADKHALGLGARLYADYVVNEMFFINAYSEFIYYFERKDVGMIAFTPLGMPVYAETDVAKGYDLTLELEPHFEYMLNEGLRLAGGLPVTYTMSPETEYNGEGADDASNMLKIGPSASLFFMKSAVPFELKLGYTLPLMGKNDQKLNTLTLQGKVYLKF